MKYNVEVLNTDLFSKIKTKTSDNYILMKEGERFYLRLTNKTNIRCNAQIRYQNKSLGTFRLESGSSFILGKKANNGFIYNFSEDSESGHFVVTFLPEKKGMDLSYKRKDGYATPINVDKDNSEVISVKLIDQYRYSVTNVTPLI